MTKDKILKYLRNNKEYFQKNFWQVVKEELVLFKEEIFMVLDKCNKNNLNNTIYESKKDFFYNKKILSTLNIIKEKIKC